MYRPDIDGLRAVAVISVVIYHAFPSLLGGGFTGVDVFFIISGYLITGVIVNGLRNNNFTLRKFYTNRVRRIFPSLILMISATILGGWFFLHADELKQLGRHIAAGSIFLSNYGLISERGYFDNDSYTKPLLHLWSLSVEEQFYILCPLMLYIAWKNSRKTFNKYIKLILILMLTWGASFFLNIATSGGDTRIDSVVVRTLTFLIGQINYDRIEAFYTPWTRFWELLSGSLLALTHIYLKEVKNSKCNINLNPSANEISIGCHQKITNNHNFVKNLSSISGLTLVFAGFLFIDKNDHFPGWYALLPTVGSVMLIAAGKTGIINRTILNNPILIYIGLVSYPLYLWHWPILSFARIVNGETPETWIRVIAVVIAFILSSLTYHFVERPIRIQGFVGTKYLVFLLASIGALGYGIYIKNGYEFRAAATSTALLDGDIGQSNFYKQLDNTFYECNPDLILKQSLTYDGVARCHQSIKAKSVEVALIGDSHAEHLFPGLAVNLIGKNVAYYIRGSLPFSDNQDFKQIFEHVLKNKEIKIVIIAAHWISRPKQLKYNSFAQTIKTLTDSGKTIYIAGDIPKFSFDPVKCKFENRISFFENKCEEEISVYHAQSNIYSPVLGEILQAFPAVRFLDLSKHFCNNAICSMAFRNQVLYRDHDHLNVQGSNYLAKRIIEFNPELNKRPPP